MSLGSYKLLSAVLLFVVALAGGFSARRVSALSPSWVQTCNAFAGGTILAVAIVHMLPDSASEMTDVGRAIAAALGGDEDSELPIAYVLLIVGFLVCMCIHVMGGGHGGHGGHNRRQRDQVELGGMPNGGAQDGSTALDIGQTFNQPDALRTCGVWPASGIATLLGLSLHSFIEALAAGTQGETVLLLITFAICIHKGFAAFALGTSFLSLIEQRMVCSWWVVVVGWCFTAPAGIAIGALAAANLNGPAVAALNCFAAGTLLFVGIVEMLLPAFEVHEHVPRKLLAVTLSASFMALLAVWA